MTDVELIKQAAQNAVDNLRRNCREHHPLAMLVKEITKLQAEQELTQKPQKPAADSADQGRKELGQLSGDIGEFKIPDAAWAAGWKAARFLVQNENIAAAMAEAARVAVEEATAAHKVEVDHLNMRIGHLREMLKNIGVEDTEGKPLDEILEDYRDARGAAREALRQDDELVPASSYFHFVGKKKESDG